MKTLTTLFAAAALTACSTYTPPKCNAFEGVSCFRDLGDQLGINLEM